MQLLFLLNFIFAASVTVHAGVIPSEPRNGVHILDARGGLIEFQPIDVRSLESDVIEERSQTSFQVGLESRAFPGTEVGCKFNTIPDNDLATARKMLKQWCDSGYKVGGHQKTIFRSGNAATYVCSYGNEQGCSSAEYDEAVGLWNGKCQNKSKEGGYVWISSWAKTYGQDVGNAEICGNIAESDPKQIAAQIGGTILGAAAKEIGK